MLILYNYHMEGQDGKETILHAIYPLVYYKKFTNSVNTDL